MAEVYLGLGSNIAPTQHLRRAFIALEQHFGQFILSPIYESEAVGFKGDNFLNCVTKITTELSVGTLLNTLRDIENQNGRDRAAARFSGRTLDIDILTYDRCAGIIEGVHLPRDEIFKNAFVLKPFSDIAPDFIPPGTQKSLLELWQQFDKENQNLWQVEFEKP